MKILFSNGLKYRAESYIFLIRIGASDFWMEKPKWLREWLMANDMIKPASAIDTKQEIMQTRPFFRTIFGKLTSRFKTTATKIHVKSREQLHAEREASRHARGIRGTHWRNIARSRPHKACRTVNLVSPNKNRGICGYLVNTK
jgi:hypothetical protein